MLSTITMNETQTKAYNCSSSWIRIPWSITYALLTSRVKQACNLVQFPEDFCLVELWAESSQWINNRNRQSKIFACRNLHRTYMHASIISSRVKGTEVFGHRFVKPNKPIDHSDVFIYRRSDCFPRSLLTVNGTNWPMNRHNNYAQFLGHGKYEPVMEAQ